MNDFAYDTSSLHLLPWTTNDTMFSIHDTTERVPTTGNNVEDASDPNLESRLLSVLYSGKQMVNVSKDGRTMVDIPFDAEIDTLGGTKDGLVIESLEEEPISTQTQQLAQSSLVPPRRRVGSKRMNEIFNEESQPPAKRRNSSCAQDEFIDLMSGVDLILPSSPLSPSIIMGTQNLRVQSPGDEWALLQARTPVSVKDMNRAHPESGGTFAVFGNSHEMSRRSPLAPRTTLTSSTREKTKKKKKTKKDISFEDLSKEEKEERLKVRVVQAREQRHITMKKKRRSHKRGAYTCRLCGQPKKNHVCPFAHTVKRKPFKRKMKRHVAIGVQCEMDPTLTIAALSS